MNAKTVVFICMVAAFFGAGASAAENISPPPSRTVHDILAEFRKHKPDAGRLAQLRAVVSTAEPQTADRNELARHYFDKVEASDQMGDERQALKFMARVIELGGAYDLDWEKGYYLDLQIRMGDVASAMQAYKDRMVGSSLANVCARTALIRLNIIVNSDEIESTQRDSEEIFSQRRGRKRANYEHRIRSCLEGGRAILLLNRGKLDLAEIAARKAIEEIDNDAASLAVRSESRAERFQVDGEHRMRATHVKLLATIHSRQNRLFDAEVEMRQSLSATITHFGRYSSAVAGQLAGLVSVLVSQGRYAEAKQIGDLALDILQNIGAPRDSQLGIELHLALGRIQVAEGHYEAALQEFSQTEDANSASANSSQRSVRGNADWALALIKVGRIDDSIQMLRHLIPEAQKWLGDQHAGTIELRGLLGMALAEKGDRDAAIPEFLAVKNGLIVSAISSDSGASRLQARRLKVVLDSFIALMADSSVQHSSALSDQEAIAQAFLIADALRSQSTQAAVAASSVRAATSDRQIGEEIRRQQDIVQEKASLNRILRDLALAPPEQRLPKVIADMQQRIDTLRTEEANLTKKIQREFPQYFNLLQPKPPTIEEARASLAPGEALLSIFTTDTATFIWAFQKTGPLAFHKVAMGRSQVADLVQALRKSLDPGDVDLSSGLPRFDTDIAYRLYAELLQPVAEGWRGASTLLVASNGSLAQLPLSVLVTEKTQQLVDGKIRYESYKAVPWLIKNVAITEIPSVNSLVMLRKQAPSTAQRDPFVGFGDPEFRSAPTQTAAHATRRLRNLSIERISQDVQEQETAETQEVVWMDYANTPALPDTRDEILAIAHTLEANPERDVFLGTAASKATLFKLDLTKRRVIAFATHGLLADDFPGVSEPSLALANPGDGHHGLLTLEEILQLKLDADWVVLSACNTAAGDGAGADAISGLGRGFFYAGTRALLATHWPVESASARKLVTGVFERQKANPALSRAEALRQSMLALQSEETDGFAYAHPLFWAPYALIGDSGQYLEKQ